MGFVLDKVTLLRGLLQVLDVPCQSSVTICDDVRFAYQGARYRSSGLVIFHPALRCLLSAEFNEVYIGAGNETCDAIICRTSVNPSGWKVGHCNPGEITALL